MNIRIEAAEEIINDLRNPSAEDKDLYRKYVYLLALYFGDGCLNKRKNRKNSYKFRISQDAKYPVLIEEQTNALQTILPNNKIWFSKKFYKGRISSIDITTESIKFLEFFPSAKPGMGPKHTYKISLEPWQEQLVKRYPKEFLRGFIQTDGSRYVQKCGKYSYTYYNFTQVSEDIVKMFTDTCDQLGVEYNLYKYDLPKKNIVSIRNKKSCDFLDSFIGPKS